MFATVRFKLFIISFIAFFFSGHVQASIDTPDGKDLAREIHDFYIGDNSMSMVHMELVDKSGRSRVRKMVNITMDKDDIRKNFIRFLEPADIAGTGFLSVEQEDGSTQQFLYLPALDRTRRIVSAQKGRSFVNTDFTYEDMERRPVEDSEYEILGSETIDGRECWILEIRPLPEADSQYLRLISWVPKDIALPVQTHFFNLDNEHVKTYRVHELEKIQDIWTPTHVEMMDKRQEHRTILITEEIEYNSPRVQSSIFTTRYLESW